MSELGHHMRFHLKEPRLIVTNPEERREAAAVVLERGREVGLLSFDIPDDHGHVTATCDREEAGQFVRWVESSLKQRLRLPCGFAQYEPKPIQDGRHLFNAARYNFRQPLRHGVDVDPFREASNLPDLLGLRIIGGYSIQNLRGHLPRLRRGELLEWFGIPSLEPMDGPLEGICRAALRASALKSLKGSSPRAVAIRRAIVGVVGRRLSVPELAELLGISRRAVGWLRSAPADLELVRAIRLQLGLEAILGERGRIDRPY